MNQKINFLCCVAFVICLNAKGQTIIHDKNKIIQPTHLAGFYKKIAIPNQPVKILHLGDSHIMIGNFANEIRRLLDSVFGIQSYGWVFPNQIGRFNTFYTNSKVWTGKTSFANNLHKENQYQNGIAGQSVQFWDQMTTFELSLKNIPDKFKNFNQFKVLYQSDSSVKMYAQVYDSTNRGIVNSAEKESDNFYAFGGKEKITEFNFNKNFNKLKITVDKKDSGSLFNLLGIYLENTNNKGIVYNSLGVGGSSLYSITNNNSLLIHDINFYQPDLIILSFGSNDAYNKTFDTVKYQTKLENFIDSITSKQPHISFLLTAPPDSRSRNREPVSLNAIQEIFNTVSQSRTNVAYWDLRSIMGGRNSVLNWLKHHLASKDKLHYTKAGYDIQAGLLIKALLKE